MNKIQGKTRKRSRRALLKEYKMVFAAPSRREVTGRFKTREIHSEIEEPTAVECLAKHLLK